MSEPVYKCYRCRELTHNENEVCDVCDTRLQALFATGHDRAPSGSMPLDAKSLTELAARVVQTSVDKGFGVPQWESNYLAKLMLVVTEIDEAVVAAEHRDEFAEELADIAIRTLGILHCCHEGWSPGRIEGRDSLHGRPPVWDRPEVVLWAITKYVVRAAECWRTDDKKDAAIALELALLETFRVADRCGIDLLNAIVAKDVKNQAREMRHGKKATG